MTESNSPPSLQPQHEQASSSSSRAQSHSRPVNNLRAPRSRKDRPCDACRRRKHSCLIPVRGEPCDYCQRRGVACRFDMPPRNRARARDSVSQSLPEHRGSVRGLRRDPTVPADEDGDGDGDGDGNGEEEGGGAGGAGAIKYHTLRSNGEEGTGPDGGHSRRAISNSRAISPGNSREIRPILGLFNETNGLEEELEEVEEWPDSLDMTVNDNEESHFLGSSAMQDLALLTDTPDGSLSHSLSNSQMFRQVSKDPRTQVFFIKSPAFVYGKGVTASETIFATVCGMLGGDWPSTLLGKFLQNTLPAFPILNTMRLLAACNRQSEAGPLPNALLCAIMGHSIAYEPALKHMFKDVWKQVVKAEDEEYKQPRLQTLQIAIIDLTTRPSQAHAMNAMSLARSVSIGHMIGLHLDCSDWRLPRWEKSVRKRVFWALVVLDKWIAMTHGRPSLMHRNNRSVPLPTRDDTDWGEFSSNQPEKDTLSEDSMSAFIGQCELALIVEDMLDGFYSLEGQSRASAAMHGDLRRLSSQLDAIQARGPKNLIWKPGNVPPAILAPGVRCYQLTFLGVRVLIGRLYIISHQEHKYITTVEAQTIDVVLKICEDFVVFLTDLCPESDYNSFWLPHCAFLISTCIGLLIRVAVRVHNLQSRSLNSPSNIVLRLVAWSARSSTLINQLVNRLRKAKNEYQWEPAESAMILGNDLLRSVATVLPEVGSLADEPIRDLPNIWGDWSWVASLSDFTMGDFALGDMGVAPNADAGFG